MKGCAVVALFAMLVCSVHCTTFPLFKVFCDGVPLYRGRADPIVAPGSVSGHIHRVAGGSGFSIGSASDTPLQAYQRLRSSSCTTCSINQADFSAYWHPDLYYQWPNGTLSLVPFGGLTIYYLSRGGDGNQTNPTFTAFPPGFRMISGNPFRRTYNASSAQDNAITFVCISSTSNGPQTNGFPTGRVCDQGLRLQVNFPQCWDGKNLDSPTHNTHVSFPMGSNPDSGDCPPGYPVRTLEVFFEAFYSVSAFPHGGPAGSATYQPFVLACGDSTGYGFHGDFLNGWDQTILQNAINDPSCVSSNTAYGNNVKNCNTLSQYVQTTYDGVCNLTTPIHLTEMQGLGLPQMTKLPGCNPISGAGATAAMCSAPPSSSYEAPVGSRFHLKAPNGNYVTGPSDFNDYPLVAKVPATSALTYYEVFNAVPYGGNLVALQMEANGQYVSASGNNGALWANRGSVSGWEQFTLISQGNNQVAIQSNRNNDYVVLQSDNTLAPTATSITSSAIFTLVAPTGGGI